MALFILIFLIINNCLLCLLGFENNSYKVLEIKSTTSTMDQSLGFYKVDETLNLTCTLKNESSLPNVNLEWVIPNKAFHSQNQTLNIYRRGTNAIVLIIENLQEYDSGEYTCKAFQNGTPLNSPVLTESSMRIKVKNKKKECTDVMFQCSPGICIHKRYTCDGFKDCRNGEDESPGYCGPGNPCDNKLMCPDYRCIPFTWCCESHREPNCTTKVKHSCCNHVEKLTREVDNELGFQFEQQRFSDMGFLQTTVYTVIGCATAFMFIVTIIVIATSRVHLRRTFRSRCPGVGRSLAFGRGGNLHLSRWSFCDLDVYLNRPSFAGNDLVPVNPLLVTYNMNRGVQFVGRPIDPPPYCEIVTSPPKEGPPPPYASREDLCVRRCDKTDESKTETCDEAEVEPTESDALLCEPPQNISVISCNAIDVVPPTEEVPPDGGDPLEPVEVRSSLPESRSKESGDVVNESSQCNADVNKCDGEKNEPLSIIVVGKDDSATSGTLKRPTGESSSFAGNVSDLTKSVAVKQLYSAKSLDNNFRLDDKNFSTSHNLTF